MSAAVSLRAAEPERPAPALRAAAVAPTIAAHADEVEQQRRLPPALLDALHGAALFRALLPRSLGGDETDPASYVRMMETIARADASTAWCVGQASGCSMASAYMDPDAAWTIWGDKRAALAWGAGPLGTAQVVDGGFRVTGKWSFASGGHNATWIGGHCRILERDGSVRLGAEGEPFERSMLFPAGATELKDTWHVMGLRGTGSDTYAVTDLFVPAAFSVTRDTEAERRETGTLYRFSTTNMYSAGFAGVALGIARGALDALIELARGKTPSATARALRDSPVVQSNIAQAEAKLRAARALLLTTLDEAWDEAAHTGGLSLDHKMSIRLASTYAIHQAKEVTTTSYGEAGATAVFQSNPFERRLRDAHSVSQQVQARTTHFETVGQHLLGLPANLRFI
ncbi:MAG: acyl-CoA dehydrogenase family protein [Acetobacteraceae bacterium]